MVRYKQTFLGVAWAILVPTFTAAVYVIVFGRFANFPSGSIPYPQLVLSGLLPMQYFTSSLAGSSTSLVANLPSRDEGVLPAVLLPLAAAIVPIVDLLLGFVVLVPLMAYCDTWPEDCRSSLAPLFIGLAFVTALGVGLLLSGLNVRYRDVPTCCRRSSQMLPLLSGVPYAIEEIPEKWQWLLALNPMTGVISGWRWASLGTAPPELGQVAVGAAVAAVLLHSRTVRYFRRSEPRFADTI